MDKLGLKDLSRANQLDCVISYFFQLHLMLHACVKKFDVTDTVENFWELNRAKVEKVGTTPTLKIRILK